MKGVDLNLRHTRLLAIVGFAAACLCAGSSAWAATAPDLGTAETFVVLGASTVTNTGTSVLTGDLGLSPGLSITGFPPGVVNGTTYVGGAVAMQAQSDLVTAYNDLAGQACDTELTGVDLGGLTLPPGAYCFSSSAQLTGTLTLDAQGDPNAVFVFQIGSSLTTASSSVVEVINGGSQCNVFWQVGSSATLGTSTVFAGSILALTSITSTTSADVSGQLLALNGAVTLDTITAAVCIPVCPAITLSPLTLPTGQTGVPYSVPITATGGTAPYTFAVTAGTLPPGLTLSTAGLLSGTPTTPGTSIFTITATDANGCTGFRNYTITINPLGCPILTILPARLPNAAEGSVYTEPITASGSVPDTYVYSVTAGMLPPGLALTPVTPPAIKTVNLAGTPTTVGTYSFTITAADSMGCLVSQAYTIVVNPPPCPAITVLPPTLPNPQLNVPYSETISATGGTGLYLFTVTAGMLPPGLEISPLFLTPNVDLAGTPTAVGDYSFTITATDEIGCPGIEDYVLSLTATVTEIPTLSGWTMILLASVLALLGLAAIRRLGT